MKTKVQRENMSIFILRSVVSGVIFGAALTAAGVYSPSVIVGQMHLTNFHMLKTFLAASASSAYVFPPSPLPPLVLFLRHLIIPITHQQ
jgi:hypothetical protein